MADLTKSKEEILNDIALNLLIDYDSKGLRASGKFERITNVVKKGGEPVLILPHYTKYITDGVGSIGGFNPGAIAQWIRDKGILARDPKTGRFRTFKQTAFAIAKKISEQGTDIYLGQREGLYLRTAINRAFENKGGVLIGDIVEHIFSRAGLKDKIEVKL